MMRRIYFLVFLLLCCYIARSQQLPVINQFVDNLSILNSGSVSSEYMKNNFTLQSGINYRTQWVGLEGAPKTQSIILNKIIDAGGSFDLGFGGHLVNDQVGPIGTTGIHGRLSTIFGTGRLEDGIFSTGISLGLNQYRINFDEIEFAQSEFIDQTNAVFLYPDIGAGIFYAREIEFGILDGDLIYAGASVPQLFALNLQFKDQVTNKTYSTSRTKHFYANAGIVKYYDDLRYFELGTWIKYLNGNIFHIDVISKFKLNESFWIGGGISSNKSFSVETGSYFYDIFQSDTAIKISYAFVNYFQENSVFLNVSHEFSIQYLLYQANRRSYSF